MMKWIRFVSIFLLLTVVLSLLSRAFAGNRGVSLSSDSNFFAQLNLNAEGLEKVKTAVNAGNYAIIRLKDLTEPSLYKRH